MSTRACIDKLPHAVTCQDAPERGGHAPDINEATGPEALRHPEHNFPLGLRQGRHVINQVSVGARPNGNGVLCPGAPTGCQPAAEPVSSGLPTCCAKLRAGHARQLEAEA